MYISTLGKETAKWFTLRDFSLVAEGFDQSGQFL